MAGKGGGAWKVAYADFVTAMMAFFMVMWIVAQGKPAVKQAVSEYFQDPYKYYKKTKSAKSGVISPSAQGLNLPHEKGTGSQLKPTKFSATGNKSSTVKGQKGVDPGKMMIASNHDGKQEWIGTMVQFDPLSTQLNDEAKEHLRMLAPALIGKRHKIEIRGHSMRRRESEESPEEAWMVAYARCVATMNFLIEQKIDPDRFRLSQASTFEPRTINGDMQTNARVDVYLLNEITDELVGTKEERAERFQTPVNSSQLNAEPDDSTK